MSIELVPGGEMKIQTGEAEFLLTGPDGLARFAEALIRGMRQEDVAEEVGITQPRVSEAIAGRNYAAAKQIINHYCPNGVSGPLYYVSPRLKQRAG